jgi:hypothetical protein
MTRCPSCGTHNQDSRKACSRCGKALPQTEIKCSDCGALNPVGNIFCDSCNARLILSSQMIPPEVAPVQEETGLAQPLKGISLPSRAGVSQGSSTAAVDLPDWMLDLSPDDGFGAETEQASGVESSDGGYADWLSDLLDGDVQFAETDQAGEEGEGGLALAPEQLPDWLAVGPAASAPAPIPEEAAEDLPDWLSSISDQLGPIAPESGESEPRADQPFEASLPDWLAGTADVSVPSKGTSSVQDSGALPDWLAGTADSSAPSRETPSGQDSDTLLDWFAGESFQDARQTPVVVDQPATTESSLFGDSFGWLDDQEEIARRDAVLAAVDEAASANSDLPEWLAQAQRGDRDELVVGAATEAAPRQSDLTDGLSIDEAPLELPDWLATIGHGEDDDSWSEALPVSRVNPEAELPNGSAALSEAGPPARTEPQARKSAVLESDAEPFDEFGTTPDWLSGIGAHPTGGSSAVFTAATNDFEEDSSQSESPAWMKGLAAGAGGISGARVPAFITDEFEEEGIPEEDEPVRAPDWLQNLEMGDPAQVDDLSQVDVALDKADLPLWLQNLRPSEAGGSGKRGDDAVADDLIPADIPDWVQAMRPVPGERGNGARDRMGRATPAEAEGPLVGLPGVLPGLSLVDVPSETKVGFDHGIPEAVVKQAQLWQHLLEQPRSAERPITQAARGFQTSSAVRVILSLVLLLGVFAAILFLPEGMKLSQANPLQVAPGAADFVQRIDRIEPGQRVLLAFEYTPAYADEMAQMARPVLEHLDDRQAQLIIVSTIPEGTGLGLGLIAEVRYEGLVTDAGYLSGNFNGIASFLDSAEARSVDHVVVLTSQSERLRWWIEQGALAGSQQQVGLPFSAGVSASVRPLVAPYLQARGVQGWIGGFSGALAYREVRGELLTGFYARTWDVLMLAHWFAAALLFVGVLYSLVAGKKGAH